MATILFHSWVTVYDGEKGNVVKKKVHICKKKNKKKGMGLSLKETKCPGSGKGRDQGCRCGPITSEGGGGINLFVLGDNNRPKYLKNLGGPTTYNWDSERKKKGRSFTREGERVER